MSVVSPDSRPGEVDEALTKQNRSMTQLASIDNIVTGWLITQTIADVFITGKASYLLI